jgi:indolepyruvate decarboxylase
MHHTFANGEYDQFRRMSEPVVCAHAVMTPQNAAYETERLIFEALYHRRPVYMAFPADLANQPVLGADEPLRAVHSDPAALEAATEAVAAALEKASTACLLIGMLVERVGLRDTMLAMVDTSGLPFATMFMGKSVLDEQHPSHMGMYAGALMNEPLRDFIESCDRVLLIGARMTDLNSGAFTAHLDPAKLISVGHHVTQVDGKTFAGVEMGDILKALAKRLVKSRVWKKYEPAPPDKPAGSGNDPITADALYPRWEKFFKPDDILVAETGTASMGLGFIRMPAGASFHNQTLWGSIGWATPAAFGMAVAAPGRRIVLVTGEGAHQMTVQEIGQFGRLGLKPIIFVLNNNGYLIERLLCKDPDIAYNDVAPWRYTELPHALGCDGWFVARAATCGELDAALEAASKATTGVYIEVVTDTYAASPLALKLHEALTSLYRS